MDALSMAWLSNDIRYAVRSFRHKPVFFSLVVGILALGLAASVSVFSLVDAVLLRPLPYRDPQRLVTLTSFAPKPPFDSNGSLSNADFQVLKANTRSFDDLAITFREGWSRVTLTGETGPNGFRAHSSRRISSPCSEDLPSWGEPSPLRKICAPSGSW
jgi:hypothetical protein